MLINVTKEDIREGIPCNSRACPVGRAIFNKVKKAINVGTTFIVIGGSIYQMPRKVRYFIKRFDYNKNVTPFSFTLRKRRHQ